MPPVKASAFQEDTPADKLPELLEEERDAVKQKLLALEKLLADQQKAKYKIEVFFGSARSLHRPTPGAVSFWENGTMLHGGGDAKIYLCPGKSLGRNTCEKPIPFALNAFGFLTCPHCQVTWKGHEVIGEVFARKTMRGWAELVYRYFRLLEHNCDIYVKHAREDIRSAAHAEQAKQMHGEVLSKSRNARALYIYPLKNIIQDTSNGADVLTRFHALLTA